jgi:hypothetical protein
LNEILEINDIKITQVINKGEYHDVLKFDGNNETGFMEIWFNKNNFFTKASINSFEGLLSDKLHDAIKQLKNA